MIINLDIQDMRVNTHYPFEYESNVNINDTEIPVNRITSLQIRLYPDYVPPVRMSEFKVLDADTVRVKFCDASNNDIGYCDIPVYTNRNFIYDTYGRVIGSITWEKNFGPFLMTAVQTAGGTHVTSSGAFILLTDTCVQDEEQGCSIIRVNEKPGSASTTITGYNNFTLGYSDKGIEIGLYGDSYTVQVPNTITELGGLPAKGRALIISQIPESNIRVITTGNEITLSGVSDV